MAHELEIRDGQACMMYAGETPWHKLGTKVEKEVTAAACMRLAGLDTECEKRPLFIRGKSEVDGIPVIGSQVQGKYAVVRLDDEKVLGVVGESYQIIQNRECFDFLDSIVGEGQALYHTAGSLFGGSRIFITLKLPEDSVIGDDKVERYVLLATSHDGSLALTARMTGVRVVCANTLAVALGRGTQQSVTIYHTQNYKDKVAEARRVLGLADLYYRHMETEFNKMLDAALRESDLSRFVNSLFPDTQKAEGGKVKASASTIKKRDRIRELARAGRGNKAVAGTRYAAFQAVTEFVTHERNPNVSPGRDREDVRVNSMLFGSGRELTQRAFDLLQVR
jgi:phage/plasmid-like protein (TIGR03299 family)